MYAFFTVQPEAALNLWEDSLAERRLAGEEGTFRVGHPDVSKNGLPSRHTGAILAIMQRAALSRSTSSLTKAAVKDYLLDGFGDLEAQFRGDFVAVLPDYVLRVTRSPREILRNARMKGGPKWDEDRWKIDAAVKAIWRSTSNGKPRAHSRRG